MVKIGYYECQYIELRIYNQACVAHAYVHVAADGVPYAKHVCVDGSVVLSFLYVR